MPTGEAVPPQPAVEERPGAGGEVDLGRHHRPVRRRIADGGAGEELAEAHVGPAGGEPGHLGGEVREPGGRPVHGEGLHLGRVDGRRELPAPRPERALDVVEVVGCLLYTSDAADE